MNKRTNVTVEPAPRKPRSIEEQIEWTRYEVDSARKSVLEKCEEAVARLESFAADARRDLERAKERGLDEKTGWGEYVVTKLPQDILHKATWGLSNAMSEVETASSYATRYSMARGQMSTLESLKADGDRQGVQLLMTEVA